MDKLDYFKNASYHLKNSSCFLGADEWKAKLESAYSFMLKYSKITVCKIAKELTNLGINEIHTILVTGQGRKDQKYIINVNQG